MTSAGLCNDKNVCEYQQQQVISKQQTTTKRINCINYKVGNEHLVHTDKIECM